MLVIDFTCHRGEQRREARCVAGTRSGNDRLRDHDCSAQREAAGEEGFSFNGFAVVGTQRDKPVMDGHDGDVPARRQTSRLSGQ
jgi:hypothetical protein